jgi:hypothetical protein
MSRFPSFNNARSETRRVLRDRFVSKLRVVRQGRFLDPERKVTPDQLVLRLLAGLKVSSNAEWPIAEIAYASAGPKASEPPDLQALADLGWVRRIWGRAETGLDLRLAAHQTPAGPLDAFKILLSDIHDQHYQADPAIRSDPGLAEIVNAIEVGRSDPTQIVSRTPEWIASRLWEIILMEEATPDKALRRWAGLWTLLQHPSLVPAKVWSESDADAFCGAAFRAVATEPGLGDWITTRDLYARQAALAHNVAAATIHARFPPPPTTLVDRALWTQSPPIEASGYDSLRVCAELLGLARVLLAEADAEDNSAAPHPAAAQLVDLSIDRAELFIDLLFQVQARPRLLADLVIHPPSAGLACLLIAQWRSPSGAWDRGLTERDFQINQAEAFADAVAILADHLRASRTDAGEAAALLNWLHDRARPGFIDDVAGADSLITALRRELADCTTSTLLAMAQALDGPELHQGVGTSEFAAVLDLSALGGVEDGVDAEIIVGAYVSSIARGDYSLSAHRIGAAGAAALARIAGRTQALRARFLKPLDVRARLAAAKPQDNEFALADSIGRSLRIHVRILCRAVIGGAPNVPNDLFDALVTSVRAGSLQHKEKNRVAAFAARFESSVASTSLRSALGR